MGTNRCVVVVCEAVVECLACSTRLFTFSLHTISIRSPGNCSRQVRPWIIRRQSKLRHSTWLVTKHMRSVQYCCCRRAPAPLIWLMHGAMRRGRSQKRMGCRKRSHSCDMHGAPCSDPLSMRDAFARAGLPCLPFVYLISCNDTRRKSVYSVDVPAPTNRRFTPSDTRQTDTDSHTQTLHYSKHVPTRVRTRNRPPGKKL